MSAGAAAPGVMSGLDVLAPKFRDAIGKSQGACIADGLDVRVFETYRTDALQAIYFARGRTVVPPTGTVTNAASNLYSWHGYGLAVDLISAKDGWNPRAGWYDAVAAIFRQNGCRWGGEWKIKDLPHFQWGLCKPSPSDLARQLIAQGGLPAVWKAVGAE